MAFRLGERGEEGVVACFKRSKKREKGVERVEAKRGRRPRASPPVARCSFPEKDKRFDLLRSPCSLILLSKHEVQCATALLFAGGERGTRVRRGRRKSKNRRGK
jgi:hypothetical protein